MTKIKTRNLVKGTIKTIDKGAIALSKTKDNIVNIKEKFDDVLDSESNPNEYANSRFQTTTEKIVNRGVSDFNKRGKKN